MTDTPRPDRTLAEIAERIAVRFFPRGQGSAAGWQRADLRSEILAALSSVQARTREAVRDEGEHRCSGCGHRWDGPLNGATLCGDCWRTGQAVILGHGAGWVPMPMDTWRGLCGHHWLKSEVEGCPICQLATVRRDTLREAAEALERMTTADKLLWPDLRTWLRARADEQEPQP